MNDKERIQNTKAKLGAAMKALIDLQSDVWELEIDALMKPDPTPELPQDVIEAYWRLKGIIHHQHGPVTKLPVLDLMKALANIIGDDDWPDLSVFDKLFIDKKDAG